jgi:cbb3-type cytochrome c oxidase subunit III
MRLVRNAVIVAACASLLRIASAGAIEPQKLQNPVAADAASIAAGKQVYEKNCGNCHGDHGKGDGQMGEELNPRPADLTDAEWKHGSSDGEIFTVIHNGVPRTGMRAFGRKLTTRQIWDVINYVRSLGPQTH